ncbi:MAG: glycosyltransferase [Lachnoclostridium sp.]|nr:glycosyltransferase [Lachnoclostridium sp.]
MSTNPTAAVMSLPAVLRGKKILLVNHSDTLGGASVVTFRLMRAMLATGLDVKLLVFTKTGDDPLVDKIGTRFLRGLHFGMERIDILMRNDYNYGDLYKVSTGRYAYGISSHKWVREADIICLNWINQGMMGVDELLKLHKAGKKIVWTMHDMWCMTGICHHSYECRNYEKQCGLCPFLGPKAASDDISHKIWAKKMNVYQQVPVKFVAVSHWLEECGRRSSLLSKADLRVIPNLFPINEFTVRPSGRWAAFDIYRKPNVICFGAARLDDPIKGLPYAIDALNYIFDNYPEVANDSVAFFFGNVKNPEVFDQLRFSHVNLGRLNDMHLIRHLYAASKVVLSTSLYETLPGTLIEGQACGAVPVTFGRGGQADIVEHKVNGYIADYLSSTSIAEGIMWALRADISRDFLHEEVRRHFDAETIVGEYIRMFEEFYV